MVNYGNGRIYAVRNKTNDKVYIGSTTRTLSRRMTEHRSRARNGDTDPIYQSMREVGVEVFYIELVEEFPCQNKEQLTAREGYWVRQMDTYQNGFNGNIPARTNKEWAEENKEKVVEYRSMWVEENKERLKEYKKQHYQANREEIREKQRAYNEEHKEEKAGADKRYYEANKEAIQEYKKSWSSQKVQCECGIELSRSHLTGHRKTKKHLELEAKQA